MERVRSSRQNLCTDFIDGESYTTDFRSVPKKWTKAQGQSKLGAMIDAESATK